MCIKRGSFIDFFAYTPTRLDLLKQMGATSKPSSLIPGSNIWISTSAPIAPDAANVVRSKANLAAGFHFYLSRLNLSKKKKFLVQDRIAWWSWLQYKFNDNDRALLYFTCNFLLKFHASHQWAVDAENASHLYSDAKVGNWDDGSKSKKSSAPSDRHHESHGKKVVVKRGTPHSGTWSPAQKKAVRALTAQCPPKTCMSRIIKGHPCHAIKKNIVCPFAHVCGWCKSPSCEAACSLTPPSPL